MDYVKALIIKLLMCTAVIWFVLGVMYNVNFGHVITLSLFITIASFILGDIFLLPKFENWGATIADFILVFAAVWIYSANFINVNFSLLNAAAITAIIIAIGEIFFHQYVDRHILHVDDRIIIRDDDNRDIRQSELKTEFGEEIDPAPDDEHDKR